MLVIFTYSWRETWRTEYWPPSSAQTFLKNHINQLPMCFSIFQLPYGKIFSDALKDTKLHTESTNAPAIHRQRHHQAPGWLNLVEI